MLSMPDKKELNNMWFWILIIAGIIYLIWGKEKKDSNNE